tara:strand:- start:173 stop:361 length:189 start_codon:yes stop_codon:yes gene_type:complete
MCRSLLGYFGAGRGNCLYYPTCSDVIRGGLVEEGVIKTLYKIIPTRAFICNPLYKKFGNKWQ